MFNEFIFSFALSSAPGRAPTDINATVASSTAVAIAWTKIPSQYIIGTLPAYAVFYSSENATMPMKKSVSGGIRSTVLTGLRPNTMYSVQVAGVNQTGGMGPLSEVVSAKTFRGMIVQLCHFVSR